MKAAAYLFVFIIFPPQSLQREHFFCFDWLVLFQTAGYIKMKRKSTTTCSPPDDDDENCVSFPHVIPLIQFRAQSTASSPLFFNFNLSPRSKRILNRNLPFPLLIFDSPVTGRQKRNRKRENECAMVFLLPTPSAP
jgi:hypothetical protein